MPRPDFTGTWTFNPGRSVLQIPPPDSLVLRIDHRDPLFRISRTYTAGGKSDSFTLDLTTDGTEVTLDRGDLKLRARAYWDGDTLVFDSELVRGGEEGSNLVRYSLEQSLDYFVAGERFRSASLNYDNTWVLNRTAGHGMDLGISEEPIAGLSAYARIPIAFEVTRVFDVSTTGTARGGTTLSERALDAPYVKDYDAIEGEGPTTWPERFDVSRWGLFAARLGNRRVGGAAVAFRTPGLTMLEGRDDLAVLWDIRVSPDARGQGVGSGLLRAAEAWATARGCRQMKVETQNINVPACHFYAKQGFALGAAHHFAYPALPDEIQLLWYKDLAIPSDAGGGSRATS